MPSLLRSLKQYFSYAAAKTFYSNYLPELCETLLNKNGLKLHDDSGQVVTGHKYGLVGLLNSRPHLTNGLFFICTDNNAVYNYVN